MPVPDFAHGVTDSNYWFAHLKSMSAPATTVAAKTDAAQAGSSAPATKAASTDSGSSFWDDLLDVVNPLQHLPVVSTVYRAITGDKIGDVEKVAGDTLYGGPMGLASSLADVAFEKITGKDFGSTMMAFIGLDHSDDDTTALAANTPKTDPKATAATRAPLKLADAGIATAAPTPITNLAALAPVTVPVQAATPLIAPADSKPVDISADTDALLSALARNGVTGQMQTQALDAYRRTMSMNAAPLSAAVN